MLCSSEIRREEVERICFKIREEYKTSKHIGVLLCEGDENSIDVKLYSKVYYYFLVIPSGGYTDIIKILPSVQKRMEGISIFGLIDRDANSKEEIKTLRKEKNVYCTKLPFIENIICTPEVIKIICAYLGMDYKVVIKEIKEKLMHMLSKKLKDTLPINMCIPINDLISNISFSIEKNDGTILKKTVSETSILYSYRDKVVASVVADAFKLKGRQRYYEFIAEMLNEPCVSIDIIKVTSAYLPMIMV